MNVPKEPILAAVFIGHLIVCLLCQPIATRLSGRPEWIAIDIACILLVFSFSNQTDKNRQQLVYPGNTLMVTAGVRFIALAVFWTGLVISAYAASNLIYMAGLTFAGLGIVLASTHMIVTYRRWR